MGRRGGNKKTKEGMVGKEMQKGRKEKKKSRRKSEGRKRHVLNSRIKTVT